MALWRCSRQLIVDIAAARKCVTACGMLDACNSEHGGTHQIQFIHSSHGLPPAACIGSLLASCGQHAVPSTVQQRNMSSNPVVQHIKGIRQAMQLPPNPFTYRPQRVHGPKQVLYQGRGMLLIRFLVRMKVFQLAGVFMVVTLLSMVMSTENPNPRDIAAAAAVALGCVVTSYCIWYYSGRYVGELSLLLPERKDLCFSVLDFWGSRQDNVVRLADVDAPFRNRSVSEVKAMVKPPLMPLKVKGGQDYYISMGHGIVKEEQILLSILYGKFGDGTEEPGEQQTGKEKLSQGIVEEEQKKMGILQNDQKMGQLDDLSYVIHHSMARDTALPGGDRTSGNSGSGNNGSSTNSTL